MKVHRKIVKFIALGCIFSVVLQAFSGCTPKLIKTEAQVLGERAVFTFYSDDADAVRGYTDSMTEALMTAEADFSLKEGSDLHTLNETGVSYVSASLKKALEDSVIICTALGDITDITMGGPTELWGFYTDSPAVPDTNELKNAIEAQSVDNLVIARDSHKVTVTEGTKIDMSPVARGIALDRAFPAAKLCEFPFSVKLGDMLLVCGEGPDGGEWKMALRDPFGDGEKSFAEIGIRGKGFQNNAFASSSGIWENGFTVNGKAYHGYLDPETGYPCDNGLVAVTVVTESGITADALSDAVFINGFTEKSLDYLESFFAEAVFVFEDGSYYVTEGLRDSFRLLDSSFSEHREAPATELF